jgi:hypothetical protein
MYGPHKLRWDKVKVGRVSQDKLTGRADRVVPRYCNLAEVANLVLIVHSSSNVWGIGESGSGE